MGDWLPAFVEWMEQIPPLWAYLAIFAIAYGENVIPPIPGDMVVVFGGYLVGVGKLSMWLVVLLGTVGGALGFMTMYAVGYLVGEKVLEQRRIQWLPMDRVDPVRRWLRRWGYGVVAANRFLSGARSVISLTVGMAETPVMQTAAFATLSAAVWTSLIAYGGYALGENWPLVGQYIRAYGEFVLLALAILAVAFLAKYLYSRRFGSGGDGNEGGTSGSGALQ